MRIAKLLLPSVVAVTSCAGPNTASSGATSDPVASHDTQTAPTSDSAPEQSVSHVGETPAVPPGLNDRYEQDRAVGSWKKRFEREGREVRDRRKDVLAKLDLKKGEVVADIGAGTGLYTLHLARAVGDTGKVFAVDIQDYFLEHIDNISRAAKLPQVETVKATHKSVELAPGSVDVVFFCDAYHHVEYPRTYLKTVFDALKPGGRVFVIDYRRPEPGAGPADDEWLRDHIRASPGRFRGEFEAAGFTFVKEHDLLKKNFFFVFQKPE